MKKRLLSILLGASLVLGLLTACGSGSADNTAPAKENDTSGAAEVNGETENEAAAVNMSYTSSTSQNLDKEYFLQDYTYLQKENSPTYGVDSADEVVFQSLTYEELNYLLQQEGNYLILLGGSWCPNTTSVIDYINYYANQYGVDTVYNFDFRLDGTDRATHIRENITAQESYTGEDKAGSSYAGADYNYLYGELVERYLTNLNDWVEYQVGTDSDLTYIDAQGEERTVAKVQVPFLFLYNKDNTVNNSGAEENENNTNENGTFPIVYGFEKMVYRDAEGGDAVYTDSQTQDETTLVADYAEQLENAVFKHIQDENIVLSTYSDADYVRDAFAANTDAERRAKAKDIFAADEQINIRTLTYRQFDWLLQQEGDFLILLGGAWCGNTQAVIATINDYAVANDLTVYLYDTRLDNRYAADFWGYEPDLNTRSNDSVFANLYVDPVTKYLTNIVTLDTEQTISYTDEDGQEIVAARLQVPYLLAYNKDALDEDGLPAPITGYYEQMLVLDDSEDDYVYSEENYAAYKAGVYGVIEGYAKGTGITPKEISVDRSAQ